MHDGNASHARAGDMPADAHSIVHCSSKAESALAQAGASQPLSMSWSHDDPQWR